ncbi:MAG: hypothetical protein ACRDOL_27115 [Streptosporangiaceae bacterium]
MSVTPEPGLLGPQISLFDHALQLHRAVPDSPLPRDGEPYPDAQLHAGARPRSPKDRRRQGIEAAAVLDRHFAQPGAQPSDLADAFHDVFVPIHHNEHITAAARRADRQRVRETGSWLVRHSTDRCSATVGLAMLASDWTAEDIPLIQTIGLLSDRFGPLAAHALQRRQGGTEALLWLAERAAGWGRVYVIEALCKGRAWQARPWLLRRACDGDFLNGYFAGQVASAAHLHEAITASSADDDLVDHAGRLLRIMTDCGGMGMSLAEYPPAPAVLLAHAGHARRQAPTLARYASAAAIARYLAKPETGTDWPPGRREDILRRYLAFLNQDAWTSLARAGLAAGDSRVSWLASIVEPGVGLRAFAASGGEPAAGLSFACAFCSRSIQADAPDLLTVTVTRDGVAASQELFTHGSCLTSRLAARLPLGEVFGIG